MKTRINPSKRGNSIMVKFEEGFSTYTLAVPMPYAVSFFLKGLLASLAGLQQKKELQRKMDEKEGMKSCFLSAQRPNLILSLIVESFMKNSISPIVNKLIIERVNAV